MLPFLTPVQWLLAATAALCVGLAKSGFSGLGMVPVLLMAEIFPARESTGALLPMLICGDVLAVAAFRRHARWSHLLRTLPPAVAGVAAGWWLMRQRIPEPAFRAVIGGIVLALAGVQIFRKIKPSLFGRVPHRAWFAWLAGGVSGVTTMLANAAGPVLTLYLLAVRLPKWEFVGTASFFFLTLNVVKIPFSISLGLIHPASLGLDALLFPLVALGIFSGRKLMRAVSQALFENLALAFAVLAAARLLLAAR